MIKKPFYITTTLPYVNADPHIGFAMEIVRADVVSRYKRGKGYDVFFNTGTDEHGAKIYENSIKEGVSPQGYVDIYAKKFRELTALLNIENVNFIRTTDDKHVIAAKEIWKRCYKNGDIYKKEYKIKYCIGCELEKTESELVDNKCPIHPNRNIEVREEENYFFRWSKYQKPLLDLYQAHPDFVIPDFRFNEIKAFVSRGLEDFSISRLKSKMPWGVAVPAGYCDMRDEDKHVMYVWFDALTSYISTLDWGESEGNNFKKYWLQTSTPSDLSSDHREVVQYCGKDNLRQQSAMWQAMLMSAGIPNSTNIIINGFIVSGGVKMSKSIGNVISPFDVINNYKSVTDFPEEVLRFILCHEVSTYDDSDVTMDSIHAAYTAYLQNGIGNQVNRIMKLSSLYLNNEDIKNILEKAEQGKLSNEYTSYLDDYKINEAVHIVTAKVKALDEYIQSTEPFKLVKSDNDMQKAKEIIGQCILNLCDIGHHLYFFMPRTSMAMYNFIKDNKMPDQPLFGRLEK